MMLRRVFIALPVPPRAANQLSQAVTPLLTPLMSPVASENLHITVAYLGQIPEDKLAPLRDNLAGLSALLPQIIRISAIGPFPDSRGRILAAWLEPRESLCRLFDGVHNILTTLQLNADYHSEFRPHLTLARRKPKSRCAAQEPISCGIEFPAATLGIYQGISTDQGYRYHCFFSIERSAGSSAG